MKEPLVSVIIPLWNGQKYIEACLSAILAQDYSSLEVIVVDNASEDGSADLVTEKFSTAKLIRNKRNLGFAGGCNTGLKIAEGDILVLLNQDTIVRPNWLRALSNALQDQKFGIAGCKIFYPDGETIQHAGAWIEWPVGEAHHYGQRERDTGEWDTPRMVEYVTGAAMAFRREVLETVGFLDEAFWPGYYEDIDFCFRVREAGYEIWYIPEATLTHVESASHKDQSLLWQFYHRGRLHFLLKHLAPDEFLEQFLPAEELHQPTIISTFSCQPLCTTYLEAILRTVPILHHRWQAEQRTINEVIRGLQYLHTLAWTRDWQQTEESIKAIVSGPISVTQPDDVTSSTVAMAAPSLREFVFRSEIPIIGPLISRFRAFWYSIAAQWGIRYLIQQQDAINQHHQQRLAEMADQNALLAREIANLSLQLLTTDPIKTNLSVNQKGQ